MSTVYILGAGASHGDSLSPLEGNPPPPASLTPTPLIKGFFRQDLFNSIRYAGATAETDYAEAFRYIRDTRLLSDAVGQGSWEQLDLEQIFTSIELERAFSNPESDEAARATVIRNQLIRYIQRILGLCTWYGYGQYCKLLTSALEVEDSIITFNWDLLLDQELIRKDAAGAVETSTQYEMFSIAVMGRMIAHARPIVGRVIGGQGMFLKLHGSLNWYVCGNPTCPQHSTIELDVDIQLSLERRMGIGVSACQRCGSEMLPLLVPPLLHKPIVDNSVIRSIWGLARRTLLKAANAVVIGFSEAPTDFYAAWLLRSTLGVRNDVEIFVVNPANAPEHPEHADFKQRMDEILPHGYNKSFRTFSEIGAIQTAIHTVS